MDSPPLPIPDGLIQIWIKYEYFKRNYLVVIQKSIGEAVFSPDDETAGLVTATWQPARDPDPEPEAKKAKPNPEDPEMEVEEDPEDNPDIIITPDDTFTNLNEISDFEDGEEPERIQRERILFPPPVQVPDERHEEVDDGLEPWKPDVAGDWWHIEDHGHGSRVARCRDSVSQPDMFALYDKFAQDEIKFYEKKKGSLEDADIIQLLACRKNCEKEELMPMTRSLVDNIKLPIKKMRIVTDYWKTKVEIYREPESEKHLNLQFWRHEEGCLLWTEGENVRFIRKEPYQEVAAEYVAAMMRHPKMRFKELIFDIEPWYKGPAKFPNLEFYMQLQMKLNSALGGKKVKVRHLFIKSCSTVTKKGQWNTVVPFLRRKWLKLITIRIANDEHVDQREKIRIYSTPVEGIDYSIPKAWKSATHLDLRNENNTKYSPNWLILTTFRSIHLPDVHWQAFDDIFDASKEYPPRQGCTISVENELNLKSIKWYFSKKRGVDLSKGFAKFESDTGRRSIMIKLQDRKIIIESELVPGKELDDIDPAASSSDESWTEK